MSNQSLNQLDIRLINETFENLSLRCRPMGWKIAVRHRLEKHRDKGEGDIANTHSHYGGPRDLLKIPR